LPDWRLRLLAGQVHKEEQLNAIVLREWKLPWGRGKSLSIHLYSLEMFIGVGVLILEILEKMSS
jgi:hypothetical protein